MRLCSLRLLSEEGVAVARVRATSARKVRGRPAARIALEVAFKVRVGESRHALCARWRAAAMDFFNVP